MSSIVLLLSLCAHAARPMAGQAVVIPAGETVDDDLYVAGGQVEVLGAVTGDVIAAGGEVTITGTVGGDVIAAGGDLVVRGDVGGSVRAAGGQVEVGRLVGDDVVVAGGQVTLTPDLLVSRDVLAAAGELGLAGTIGEDLRAAGETVVLGATVGGDADVDAGELVLTAGSGVGGDLRYTSAEPATIPPGAAIDGEVRHEVRDEPGPAATALALLAAWLRAVVGLGALGLVFVGVLPRFASRSAGTLGTTPLASLGVGVGALVGLPALAGSLLIAGALLGGWWLGVLVLALFALMAALGMDVAGLWLGQRILSRGERVPKKGWAVLLGVALLTLVGLVPVFGALVILGATLVGLGALSLSLLQARAAT